jgi:hypothetical protein
MSRKLQVLTTTNRYGRSHEHTKTQRQRIVEEVEYVARQESCPGGTELKGEP